MEKTIISGNKCNATGFGTADSATVDIKGNGFIAIHITFENTVGPEGGMAVALKNSADHSCFYRCKFLGYQDTLFLVRNRQFLRDCEIYGTVDFIFGDAKVVLQNCNIYARIPIKGQVNTITAQGRDNGKNNTGTIFHNCTITATDDLRRNPSLAKTFFGRPWRNFSQVVIMQSFIDKIIDPKGWLEWEGHSIDTIFYAEFDNQGLGSNTAGRVHWPGYKIIDTLIAKKYTVRNFIDGKSWIPSTGIPFFLDLI